MFNHLELQLANITFKLADKLRNTPDKVAIPLGIAGMIGSAILTFPLGAFVLPIGAAVAISGSLSGGSLAAAVYQTFLLHEIRAKAKNRRLSTAATRLLDSYDHAREHSEHVQTHERQALLRLLTQFDQDESKQHANTSRNVA